MLGLLVPTAYFLGIAISETHVDWSYRKTLQMPVAWPRIIYFYFRPPAYSPLVHDTFDPILFLFIVICNFAAYGLVAYVVLSGIAAVTKKRAASCT
jgi:hypothetical protein